ncbi:putative fatty acyl-CoA reductase-like protein [Leptotrombidium deliense]|uniref:Fatty acyl-CoA reductase n=1 Tax=Leptotrombidium deliense TaxID=299467 RepID=A0A443SA66_9ACAR|nr:putative fatty acyl-CoA reductase-like protein [Leptotrombidium deliense]
MQDNDSIAGLFENRSVLITGATGFLGKVLVEKLLRDCRSIKKIFVLLRSKSGHKSDRRLQEVLGSIIFDRIRKECPNVLEKVIAISGDITYPMLGINSTDLSMLRSEVSIVFHSAATIRFDEPLKRAVNLNVAGTKHVIDVCNQLKNLQVF